MENLDNFALPKIEKNPFETQLDVMLTLAATLNRENTEGGESYVTLQDIYKIYKDSFGDNALAPNSIVYRITKYTESHVDTLDVFKDLKATGDDEFATNKWMLNINNKDFLKEIFIPNVKDEELDAVKEEVTNMNRFLDLRDNLGSN